MKFLRANKRFKDKKYSIKMEQYLEENGISVKNNIVCPFIVKIKTKICLKKLMLLMIDINLDIGDDLDSQFESLFISCEAFSINRLNS